MINAYVFELSKKHIGHIRCDMNIARLLWVVGKAGIHL